MQSTELAQEDKRGQMHTPFTTRQYRLHTYIQTHTYIHTYIHRTGTSLIIHTHPHPHPHTFYKTGLAGFAHRQQAQYTHHVHSNNLVQHRPCNFLSYMQSRYNVETKCTPKHLIQLWAMQASLTCAQNIYTSWSTAVQAATHKYNTGRTVYPHIIETCPERAESCVTFIHTHLQTRQLQYRFPSHKVKALYP